MLRSGFPLLITMIASGWLAGCTSVSATPPTQTTGITPTAPGSISTGSTSPTAAQPTDTPSSLEILGNGPWLSFYPGFFVSNLDGSAFTKLELPENSSTYWASIDLPQSVKGGLLAAEIFPSDNEAELWIIKMPGLKIKKVALLGDQARQAVGDYNAQAFPQTFLAPALGSLVFQQLMWSPDGRYLAFAGAIDGPSTDVYLYDQDLDGIKRMSSGPTQTQILGWSPDSQWIISASVDSFNELGYADQPMVIWANSVRGDKIIQLYKAESGYERILGWSTDHSFLACSSGFESPFSELKEVNVESGSVRRIHTTPFTEAAYSPPSNTLILNVDSYLGFVPDVSPGLYRLDPVSGALQGIFPGGGFHSLQWHPGLSQFSVTDRNDRTFTFDGDGNVGLRFPESATLYPSPDGKWILTANQGMELFDNAGNKVADIGPASNVLWLADSSGFVRLRTDTKELYQHLRSDHWKGKTVKVLSDLPDSILSLGIVYP